MNYLDLINGVLRRLREDTVSSVYQNTLSSLVAEYINDAKRQVEQAHDWQALRQDIAIGTADGTGDYSLAGSQDRATVIDVRDETNFCMLRQSTSAYMRRQNLIANTGNSRPIYYALEGTDENGDTIARLWPTPNDAYTVKFHVVQRTPDLEAEGDRILIPHQPVILIAHANAAEERGGVDSTSLQSLNGRAKRSLSDAIMLDVAKAPQEMNWHPA